MAQDPLDNNGCLPIFFGSTVFVIAWYFFLESIISAFWTSHFSCHPLSCHWSGLDSSGARSRRRSLRFGCSWPIFSASEMFDQQRNDMLLLLPAAGIGKISFGFTWNWTWQTCSNYELSFINIFPWNSQSITTRRGMLPKEPWHLTGFTSTNVVGICWDEANKFVLMAEVCDHGAIEQCITKFATKGFVSSCFFLYLYLHGSLNVPIEHHPTIRYMVYKCL